MSNDNNGYSNLGGYQYGAVEDAMHTLVRDKFNESNNIADMSSLDDLKNGFAQVFDSFKDSGVVISEAVKDRLDNLFNELSKVYGDNFYQIANHISKEFSSIISKDISAIEAVRNSDLGRGMRDNDRAALTNLLSNEYNKAAHSRTAMIKAITDQSKILTTINGTVSKIKDPSEEEQKAQERRVFLGKLAGIITNALLHNPTTKKLGQLGAGLIARWTLKNVAGNENLPLWMRRLGAATVHFQVPQSLMQLIGSVISYVLGQWLYNSLSGKLISITEKIFAKKVLQTVATQATTRAGAGLITGAGSGGGAITGLGSGGAGAIGGAGATGAAAGTTAAGVSLGGILGIATGALLAIGAHHWFTKEADKKTLGKDGKQTGFNAFLHGASGAIAGVIVGALLLAFTPISAPLLLIGGVLGALIGLIKPIARWAKDKFKNKDDNGTSLGTTPSVAGGGATYTGGWTNQRQKEKADKQAGEETVHIGNIISDKSKVATDNSLPFMKKSNAANLKLIDTIVRQYGYDPIYTSAMGGHDGNKTSGHYVGDKIDIQLMKNGKGVQPDAQLLAHLKAIGAWGDGTGALGWEAHDNQFTGGHLDLRTKGLKNDMYSNDEVLQLAARRAEFAELKKKDKNNKMTFEEYEALKGSSKDTYGNMLNPASNIVQKPQQSIIFSDPTGMGNYSFNATNGLQQQRNW